VSGPLLLVVSTLVTVFVVAAVWAVETVCVAVVYAASFASYNAPTRNERRKRMAA